MQSKEQLVKLVYKDGEVTKAITCKLLSEDNFFFNVLAIRSGINIRIGKCSVISVKPITDYSYGGGF